MTERFEMECCGEPVTMVVDDDGVTFEGWDEEAELALIELGFEPSPCWIVAGAIKRGELDKELLVQAENGNAPAVEVLLAAKADVKATDEDGETPLHRAVLEGHTDIVELLLEADADANAANHDGQTPLNNAAWEGHADVVEILLESGANVNAIGFEGYTPLHSAALEGHPNTAELLLAAGAAVSAINDDDETPLIRAYLSDNINVVNVLKDWIAEHPDD